MEQQLVLGTAQQLQLLLGEIVPGTGELLLGVQGLTAAGLCFAVPQGLSVQLQFECSPVQPLLSHALQELVCM
jgi:hypothetical protein